MAYTNSIYKQESGYSFPASDWRSIPTIDWTCEQWVDYHKALKKYTGKLNANANFVKAFKTIGITGKGSKCTGDSDFYQYFKSQGIDVSQGSLESLWNETKGFASNIGNAFKIGGYVIMGLVLFIIIILIVSITKNPEKWGSAVRGGKK